MTGAVPPPVGSDWKVWARQISDFVRRNLTRLQFRNGVDIATDDGIILWDEDNGYPVVSKNGEYARITLAQSGLTANRPTVRPVGFEYFDTTLGIPIWWDGTNWVNASGATA